MGWLLGYTYRKKCTVVATAAGAQSNYQMKLLVGESSGAAGEDMDCESNCQDFPNDIRFTAADGQTKHDYWVKSITGTTPNRLATVVIEVASVPALGAVDFYVYYGNSNDSGESNINNTFLFGDDFERADITGVYFEDFLDTFNISSASNISYAVNRPTKYASNPVFSGGTWDEDKYYISAKYLDSKYKIWYGGVDASANLYCCYAESNDGYTFTKPNLGLITYGGNTNNNILLKEGVYSPSLYYDPGDNNPARRYKLLSAGEEGCDYGGVYIYFSSDGKAFTLRKTIWAQSPPCTGTGNIEPFALFKLQNGHWIVYYQRYDTNARAIGAYISDTTDIEGTWTNKGLLIPDVSASNQKYAVGIEQKDGRFYLFLPRYNKTTNVMDLSLWVSRDGLTWLEKDGTWLVRGGAGAWDEGMLFDGDSLIKAGSNEWWFYYTGSKYNHAHSLPRQSHVGLAKVGFRRIGSAHGGGTEGIITTKDHFTLNTIKLNCDATGGGTVKLELLDTSGTPITGYTKTNFDTISTDEYDKTPTWGGSSALPTQAVKLKFYIQNAYLYSYRADCSNIHSVDVIENIGDNWIEQPDLSDIANDQMRMVEGVQSDEWFTRKMRHVLNTYEDDFVLESKMEVDVVNSWAYLSLIGADSKQWYLTFKNTGEFTYLNSAGNQAFGSYTANEPHIFSMIFHNTTNTVDYYVDDVLRASDQAGYSRSAWRVRKGEVAFGTMYNIAVTLKAPWLLIRKYVLPEPTWGAWSEEATKPILLKLLQEKGLNIDLSQKGKDVNLKLSQEDKSLNLKLSQEGTPK